MIDQCKHCTLRGDFEECNHEFCSLHESWYALEMQARLKAAEHHVDKAEAQIAELQQENEDLSEGLTASYMLGYGKAKKELAEAVRECERIVANRSGTIVGAIESVSAARDIRNRWPEYFEEDA